MPYDLELPSGKVVTGVPDNYKKDELLTILRTKLPDEFPAPEESSLKAGAFGLYSGIRTGLEGLVSDPDEAARRGLLRQREYGARYTSGVDFDKTKQIYEEDGLLPASVEFIKQIPSALAEQAANFASIGVGARAGAIGGAALGGPAGAFIGGIAGASVPVFLQLFGSNQERQAIEDIQAGREIDVDKANALGAAAAGTAAEYALLAPKIGRKIFSGLLGKDAKSYIDGTTLKDLQQLEKTAKARAKAGFLTSALKGGIGGTAIEGATEIAQQALEREQAGLDLLSEEAITEYMRAGYGAALVGGPLGGAAGTYSKLTAQSDEMRSLQEQAKLKAANEQSKAKDTKVEEDKKLEEPLLLGYDPLTETDINTETVPKTVLEPLSKFTKDSLNQEFQTNDNQTKEYNLFDLFNKSRVKEGKPALESFSIEDVVDQRESLKSFIEDENLTLPSSLGEIVGPPNVRQLESEAGTFADAIIDRLVISKAQESFGDLNLTEEITIQDIFDKAEEKNISPSSNGFKSFIERTIGSGGIESASPVKLKALYRAVLNLEPNTILPTATNASRFSESQYESGLNTVRSSIENNPNISVEQIISDISKATKLTNTKDATALLNKTIREGEIREQQEKVNNVLTKRFFVKGKEEASPDLLDMPNVKPQRTVSKDDSKSFFEVTVNGKKEAEFKTQAEADKRAEQLQKNNSGVIKNTEAVIKTQERKKSAAQKQIDLGQKEKETTETWEKRKALKSKEIREADKEIEKQTTKKKSLESKDRVQVRAKGKPTESSFVLLGDDGKSLGNFNTQQAAFEFAFNLKRPNGDYVYSNQYLENRVEARQYPEFFRKVAKRSLRKRAGQPVESPFTVTPKEQTGLAPEEIQAIQADVDALKKKLLPGLKKIGLEGVGLKILSVLDTDYAKGENGKYTKDLISISLQSKSPMRTLRHEGIHALKEMGAFTDAQWKILTKKADELWIDVFLKNRKITTEGRSLYDKYYEVYNGNMEVIQEEAIAEAFAHFDALLDGSAKLGLAGRPVGMVKNLVQRLKTFFEKLGNALRGLGYTTPEDIFFDIDEGKVTPTKKGEGESLTRMSFAADKQDIEMATKYNEEFDMVPYLSHGGIEIDTKYSFTVDEDKPSVPVKKPKEDRPTDPDTGLKLNKNGTVTVYYHTTTANAREIAKVKKIVPDENTRGVYLTNLSKINVEEKLDDKDQVIERKFDNRNMDQKIDGGSVLIEIDPALLQIDEVYDDGRIDFYIPTQEGSYFKSKMKSGKEGKMQLQRILKKRSEGIDEGFTFGKAIRRMEQALTEYYGATKKEQAVMIKNAQSILFEQHNLKTKGNKLLKSNGKLDKTNDKDKENLEKLGVDMRDAQGNIVNNDGVMSLGLSLAAAQNLNGGKLKTCPFSAICESLCLGDTAGGNKIFGGKGSLRAAGRLAQYLKTEALVVNPEAMIITLAKEINLFAIRAKKQNKTPAVRLNVLSDFSGKFWKPIIDANPDVMFYDYTKLGQKVNPVSVNHHLTYSSQGIRQVVNGEIVSSQHNDWEKMRNALNDGKNVAMAFTSKSKMPSFVKDEETGKTFRVFNGDVYDARFLDPKTDSGTGLIIGLKNKDSGSKEATAAKNSDGFFVHYDPKVDGDTVTVLTQSQVPLPVKETKEQVVTIQPQQKFQFAIYETPAFKQWFSDSKIVNEDGSPKIMYHGTAADFSTFKPKQAKSIFVTDDPDFAEDFADLSSEYMITNAEKFIPQDSLDLAYMRFMREQTQIKDAGAQNRFLQRLYKTKTARAANTIVEDNFSSEMVDLFADTIRKELPSGVNIMPLYVKARNPFDYENPEHVNSVMSRINLANIEDNMIPGAFRGEVDPFFFKDSLTEGRWRHIEEKATQRAIKSLGFDSYYVKERGKRNLAVYRPTQLKSASGNIGTFDKNNADIRYSFEATEGQKPIRINFDYEKNKGAITPDVIKQATALYKDDIEELNAASPIDLTNNIIRSVISLAREDFYRADTGVDSSNPFLTAANRAIDNLDKKIKPFERKNPQLKSKVGALVGNLEDDYKRRLVNYDRLNKDEIASGFNPFLNKRDEKEFNNNEKIAELQDAIIARQASGMDQATTKEAILAYEKILNRVKPIKNYTEVPDAATVEDLVFGLKAGQKEKASSSRMVPDGTPTSVRQDVPYFMKYNKYAITLHEPTITAKPGTTMAYTPVIKIQGAKNMQLDTKDLFTKNNPKRRVEFVLTDPIEEIAFRIGSGKTSGKVPFATYNGFVVNPPIKKQDLLKFDPANKEINRLDKFRDSSTVKEANTIMRKHFDSEGNPLDEKKWVQVGFDPRRHSYFYTRHNQKPVLTADEVIQVGGLILAKNPEFGKKQNVRYSFASDVSDSLGQDTVDAINRTTVAQNIQTLPQKIATAISPEPINDIFGRVRQQFINQYEGIERLMLKAAKELPEGLDVLRAEVSAIAGAVMSDFSAGVTAQSFKRGVPVLTKGATLVQSKDRDGVEVKGLIPLLKPLMDYKDDTGFVFQAFQFYAATRRSKRLQQKIDPKTGEVSYQEQLFTKEDLARGDALEKKYPEFKQVFKDYQVYNQGLVKYMIDTQVLTPKMGKQWMENSDYIPFYRQINGESSGGPPLLTGLAGVKISPKIAGSKERINDFLVNVIENSRAAIEAGMKNEAAVRSIGFAKRLNDPSGYAPMARQVSKDQAGLPSVLKIREKGIDTYYDVADPLLVTSLQSLSVPHIPFLEILSKPANLLREMVTRDPGFMMANLFRDSLAAWFTSGAKGYKPILDSLEQLNKMTFSKSPEAEMLISAGVGTGYEFRANSETSAEEVRKQLKKQSGIRSSKDKALMVPMAAWDTLEKGTTASDILTRAAVAKRTLDSTNGDVTEAIYQGIEIMNFNRRGANPIARVVAASIPFLNARVQGLDVLYRSGFGKMASKNQESRHKAFINRALTLTALSVLYYSLASEQEEYKTAEEEAKDNNWIIGNTKLPIPFELGFLFKVVPERISAYFMGTDKASDLGMSMFRGLSSTLMVNPIPQTVKPLLEVTANYSFFTGQPIVGLAQENIATQYQARSGTSLFARFLGENTNISPIQIDYLIRGYTGTLGQYGVMLVDAITRGQGDPIAATMKAEQLPVIKRFFASPEGSGLKSKFYEVRTELDQAVATINHLERTGQFNKLADFQKENLDLLSIKPHIRQLNKDLKQLRDYRKVVQSSTSMSSDSKRASLDSIRLAENNLLRNIKSLY